MEDLKEIYEKYYLELSNINQELLTLPDGYLEIKLKSYYQVIKGKRIGISKKPEIIKQLSRKEYLLERKKQIENNLQTKTIENFDTRTPRQIIASLKRPYQSVPHHYFYHPKAEKFKNRKYRNNTKEEHLKMRTTLDGIKVRSKSEQDYADQFHHCGILFHYDKIITIFDNQPISPDFICMNPYNALEFYLEHFGALNKPGYDNHMCTKIRRYQSHGLILNKNLFVSFEFNTESSRDIEKSVSRFLY